MNFDANVKEIEAKIGYSFKDKSLIRQAFTRTSFCNERQGRGGVRYQSNEVLEFFGDSILSAAIVTLLMNTAAERYEYGILTDLQEGDFSNIKSKLSDKKNLAATTSRLGLQEFLIMGEGDAKLGIENEPSVMEDLFESIIGAIYIDSGNDMKRVTEAVARLIDVNDYLTASAPPKQSAKNALQEWCADKKHRHDIPVYKTLSETGPDHKKLYERACYIGNKVYGVGQGKNQKAADTAAAEIALHALMAEDEKKRTDTAQVDITAPIRKLKELAEKEKRPNAEFKDLGETARSTPSAREYEIECRFLGLSTSAAAPDKRSAKAAAAQKMLALLGKNEKKTSKASPVSKKRDAKQPVQASNNKRMQKKTMKKGG